MTNVPVEQRRNIVPNPQPSSTTGWNIAPGTGGASTMTVVAGVTGGPRPAMSALRQTWTTGTTAPSGFNYVDGRAGFPHSIPVVAGTTYTFSIYGRPSRDQVLRSYVNFYNSAGAVVNGSYYSQNQSVPAGTVKRFVQTITAPPGSVFVVLSVIVDSTGSLWSAGDTLDSFGALIEVSAGLADYFDGDTANDVNPGNVGSFTYSWTGTPSLSPSIQSLTVPDLVIVATPEPSTADDDPPRIRLNITDASNPPEMEVTVTRINPDGTVTPVRTFDGNPLTLNAAGATRVGLLYDYEAPLGAPVSYSTTENPDVVSDQVTLDDSRVWLIHPGVPALSMPIELHAESLAEEEWTVQQGVYWPMGRSSPVVQTDGARKAASGSLSVETVTVDQLNSLKALLSDAGTVLFNAPADLAMGFDYAYLAVGDVRSARVVNIGSEQRRRTQLPFQVVDRPIGGSQAERTYVDLLSYARYSTLRAVYPTYLSMLAGP